MKYSLPLVSCFMYSWSQVFQPVSSGICHCSFYLFCSLFLENLFGVIVFDHELLSGSIFFWDQLYGIGVCEQLPCASLFFSIYIYIYSYYYYYYYIIIILFLAKDFLHSFLILSPIPLGGEGREHTAVWCFITSWG